MKKVAKGLRYSLTVLSHPIQGFYDMRYEKQGNVFSCLILLLLLIISFIFNRQYTGFIFNDTNIKAFNLILEVTGVLIPVMLWCVANWSITVLMDGEGRFVDIFMATCYATLPLTVTTFIQVLMSRFLSADEQTFMVIVSGIGIAYTVLLLFFGIMTVHQFTVSKNVVSIIITLAGMVFIVFLVLLFAGVFDQMLRYIAGIISEIQLRM